MHFLIRLAITTSAFLIVSYVVPGITVSGWIPAVIVALFLIILNTIVRPILIVLTLPITILTLGLFLLVINASILFFVASFVEGVQIQNFWSALLGSILISIISTFANRK
ncbi:phage holin family protein [Candidatus Kaiserbacteria bacterium]|nr:MAG: phage holin family protein [Candidatus Kaiserbacteria bacterium]